MQQTNVPFKVALGYIIVAIVLILAIGLVYRNTTTVLAINQATRDYIEKRQAADSTMSNLLKEEQTNLQQLTRAMQGKSSHNYLHEKMNSLNSGEDSVVVHSKAPKTHVAKNTTVEVMKTRKASSAALPMPSRRNMPKRSASDATATRLSPIPSLPRST